MPRSSLQTSASAADDMRFRRNARLSNSVMAAEAAIHANVHGRDVSANAPASKRVVGARLRGHDVVDVAAVAAYRQRPSRRESVTRGLGAILPSVIPAKAGIHASLHIRAAPNATPPLQRVVRPGLRRDDVGGWATTSIHFPHFMNESLSR